jgi:hypothetical protein
MAVLTSGLNLLNLNQLAAESTRRQAISLDFLRERSG